MQTDIKGVISLKVRLTSWNEVGTKYDSDIWFYQHL